MLPISGIGLALICFPEIGNLFIYLFVKHELDLKFNNKYLDFSVPDCCRPPAVKGWQAKIMTERVGVLPSLSKLVQ